LKIGCRIPDKNPIFGNPVSGIQYPASSQRNSGYNKKLLIQLNAFRPDTVHIHPNICTWDFLSNVTKCTIKFKPLFYQFRNALVTEALHFGIIFG